MLESVNTLFYYIYTLKFDGDISKLKLQTEEVQKIRWISADNLVKELKKKPDKFVPHDDYWFEMILKI